MKEILREIIGLKGISFISDGQIVNVLADHLAFRDEPAAKFVLKTFIKGGYASQIISSVEFGLEKDKIESKKIFEELYMRYGFRKEIIAYVLNAVLYALGLPEIEIKDCETTSQMFNLDSSEEHIVFSGISLAHSISEIEDHLKTRGFRTEGKKGFQIEMTGPFIGIFPDPHLYINGSPFGLTKSIVLCFESSAAMLLEAGNKLYNQLFGKYGTPKEKTDSHNIVGKDLNYYLKNVLWFSEQIKEYESIYNYLWEVKGGTVELDWTAERIFLSYKDTVNTELADLHQIQFNQDSI